MLSVGPFQLSLAGALKMLIGSDALRFRLASAGLRHACVFLDPFAQVCNRLEVFGEPMLPLIGGSFEFESVEPRRG